MNYPEVGNSRACQFLDNKKKKLTKTRTLSLSLLGRNDPNSSVYFIHDGFPLYISIEPHHPEHFTWELVGLRKSHAVWYVFLRENPEINPENVDFWSNCPGFVLWGGFCHWCINPYRTEIIISIEVIWGCCVTLPFIGYTTSLKLPCFPLPIVLYKVSYLKSRHVYGSRPK